MSESFVDAYGRTVIPAPRDEMTEYQVYGADALDDGVLAFVVSGPRSAPPPLATINSLQPGWWEASASAEHPAP